MIRQKEAFLIFDLPLFAYSLKTQQRAFKKVYAVDTGLAGSVSFRMSADSGRVLETCVFLSLKRAGKEVYYYKTDSGKEVDFLVKEDEEIRELIQVAWDIEDASTRTRELNALTEALAKQKLKEGLLLTRDTTDTITKNGKHVVIKPVYQWLLENSL